MSAHRTKTARLVDQVTADFDPYLSCDDCFEQVDAAIERLTQGRGGLDESLATHLRGCPACREEARALVVVIAEEDLLDVDAELARFDAVVHG